MTAYRVIDDHRDLENIGTLTHDQIEGHISGSLFLVVSGTSGLPPLARYLEAGSGVSFVDNGAGGSFVISSTGGGGATPAGLDTYVQFNDGGVFGADPNFFFNKSTNTLTVDNLSGSLTKLTDGSDYIIGGAGIQVVTGTNGSITITNVGAPGNITAVYAGNGLLGGGTGGDVTLSINDSVVATVSGTTFTGATKHVAGLSGSLTRLTDGSPYLVAGTNVVVTNNPNGSITISSTGGASSTVTQMMWMDTPEGDIDGINMVFTLSEVPNPPNSLMFYVNGVLQTAGGEDFILSGDSIVMNYAPYEGSHVLATYLYQIVIPAGPLASWMEVPGGFADGFNTTFTLLNAPNPSSTLMLYVNGILQRQGTTEDYTLSGNTISLNYAPPTNSRLTATYQYIITIPVVGQDITWMETPGGDLDGVNNNFTLANVPLPSGSLMFYVNGVLQRQGPVFDYTMPSSASIVMNYTPESGSVVAATYPYDGSLVTGDRPKYYANVIVPIFANTDVSLIDGNIDAAFPDMSANNFLNDYDLYLNGVLLRPGKDVFAICDYYPGSNLSAGQIKFKFNLSVNEVLCLVPVVT